MRKFYKTISILLHPIVIPTITVLLYFFLLPKEYRENQKLILLGLIFVSTYIVPILILVILKKLRLIETYYAHSIAERKIPVALMMILFFILGNTITNTSDIPHIGLLFYASSLGLSFIYLLFNLDLKISLHILSLGISIGFFFLVGTIYSMNLSVLIIVYILASGLVGNARIYLDAHSPREVYLGFIFGFISPFATYYFL